MITMFFESHRSIQVSQMRRKITQQTSLRGLDGLGLSEGQDK